MALKMLGPYNKQEEKFYEILVCHSYEALEELTPFHKRQHMENRILFYEFSKTLKFKSFHKFFQIHLSFRYKADQNRSRDITDVLLVYLTSVTMVNNGIRVAT